VHFYCRKIVVNHSDFLQEQGPMILAANHPNSFLDAIILASIFKSPIYSLARGDAFAGKLVTKILISSIITLRFTPARSFLKKTKSF
jgi:1-acyl-sn-glycerol-3-phosphate acyltransferase